MYRYVRIYMRACVCVCVCVCVHIYTYIYVFMYVSTYIYIYYDLTNPPIPSSPCNHMANFFSKYFFYIAREGHPRVPPCNDYFFSLIFPSLYIGTFIKYFFFGTSKTWWRADLRPPSKMLEDM